MRNRAVSDSARAWTVAAFVVFAAAGALYLPAAAGALSDSYDVQFEGELPRDVVKELRGVSDTVKLRREAAPSGNLLLRRAEKDAAVFLDCLHARGYFDARVDFAVREDEAPRIILFTVLPGPLYSVSHIECLIVGDSGQTSPVDRPVEGRQALKPGDPATSSAILDMETRYQRLFLEEGHPFCGVLPRDVVVDHAARQVRVTYSLRPGCPSVFGPTTLKGLESVSEDTVRRMLPWKEGEICRRSQLEKARRRLQESGLFSLIEILPVPGPDGPGTACMEVTLTERRHRSVGLGADYRSDDGPGARAFWEHRNLFGMGRRLRVSGELSELEPGIEVSYDNPFFLRDDQSLSLKVKGSELTPDPYESRSLTLSGTVERRITDPLRLSGGLKARLAAVEQRGDGETFLLLSSPWQVSLDRRDDRLDPVSGFLLTATEEPFLDVRDKDVFFSRHGAGVSWYRALNADKDLVLAARLRVGAISGDVLEDIPADTRFYAGGGGSVRGYGYEKIGPEEDGEVVGGRSLAEWSLEMRKRLTERLGLVAFVDGGAAFRSSLPDFTEETRWGAGMGVRYYTPIGPVRLDVATPLNPRSGTDAPVQVYVSVGQAF